MTIIAVSCTSSFLHFLDPRIPLPKPRAILLDQPGPGTDISAIPLLLGIPPGSHSYTSFLSTELNCRIGHYSESLRGACLATSQQLESLQFYSILLYIPSFASSLRSKRWTLLTSWYLSLVWIRRVYLHIQQPTSFIHNVEHPPGTRDDSRKGDCRTPCDQPSTRRCL